MYQKTIVTLLFLLIFGFSVQAQHSECDKYTDAALGISFCAPAGWTVGKVPGKSSVMVGESDKGYSPNINVKSAKFPGTVAGAADAATKEVLKSKLPGATGISLESKTAFTAGKARGFKAVFRIDLQGNAIRSIQYYFNGKGQTKVIITATILLSDADELEGAIDDAIRTYAVK